MNPIELHSAGATVTHTGPFSSLVVPEDRGLLSSDLRETWVIPLYFGIQNPDAKKLIIQRRHLIDDELIARLLANFDWRPRTVAAYLAAVSNNTGFTTQIGHLLLRSDVCYAGKAYCISLATFNSPQAISFLEEYVEYYLRQKELWFDQADAMAALSYTDHLNETNVMARYLDAWNIFTKDKKNLDLERSVAHFKEIMAALSEIRRHK